MVQQNRIEVNFTRVADTKCAVGLQYILDNEAKKNEGYAQIGYC